MYIPNEQNIQQIIINKESTYFMSTIDSPEEICIYNLLIFMWISLLYILYEHYASYNNYIIKYKYT